MRYLHLAPRLCLLFLSFMAWGADKPATCTLENKSIVSRSASGIAQVSNLGDIEIRCGVPVRSFPSKPGESLNGLRATAISHKISTIGSRDVLSEVKVVGGGSELQQDWVLFFVHIPLESAERDEEARRYLAKIENERPGSMPSAALTKEAHLRALENLREFVYQHQVGHFLVECSVVDGDQVMGVGKVELEVLFKGRFSDVGFTGFSPL